MKETIRTIKPDEFEALNRFLESSYGHGHGFFLKHYPDLYRREKSALDCCMIVERAGAIVSHVGTFPIEIKTGAATLLCGGIGGVATSDSERGRGHMSRLLKRSIERMEENGMSLSVLWGDRQRYSHFGYETCGRVYTLSISGRSLAAAGIEPLVVEEADPAAPPTVGRLEEMYATLNRRTVRRDLSAKLKRQGLRVFLCKEGYLVSKGDYSGDLSVLEVVSTSGMEPEIIAGALRIARGTRATVNLEPDGGERSARLPAVAESWSMAPQGMFRIIDFCALLRALAPVLAENAAGLPPFSVTIGCRLPDGVQRAGIRWDGEVMETGEEDRDAQYVEYDGGTLTGMLLGGPYGEEERDGYLHRLLPVPIHIPELDHV